VDGNTKRFLPIVGKSINGDKGEFGKKSLTVMHGHKSWYFKKLRQCYNLNLVNKTGLDVSD
tara:strand:- start:22 stop:204 length:183 start_codon:yes stop_codon:yes gene_type:complete